MSDVKLRKKILNLLSEILDYIRQRKRGKVLYLPHDKIRKLYELILKLEGMNGKISYDDVSDFVSRIHCSTDPTNDLTEFLQSSKKCVFFFEIGYGRKLIEKYRLGTGILTSFPHLPKDIRARLSKEDVRGAGSERVQLDKQNIWYMKIEVTTIGNENAIERAISSFKQNMTIYKLTHLTELNFPSDKDLLSQKFVVKCEGKILNYLFEYVEPLVSIDVKYHQPIASLSSIFIKSSKNRTNELESRILRGLEVYGMIDRYTPIGVRFLLCVVSLEGILLDKEDQKCGIQDAFCQKISYLIGDALEMAHLLFEKMSAEKNLEEFVSKNYKDIMNNLSVRLRNAYDKRSSFAHSALSNEITIDDYRFISNVLRLVIFKILRLSKFITHVKDNSEYFEIDFGSLDVYIQKRRLQKRKLTVRSEKS